MSYHCPLCEGAVKHVTDDIFRCQSCGWSVANIESDPREKGDDDGREYGDPRDEQEERFR
jgi:ribosomal protein L37AE/L43A